MILKIFIDLTVTATVGENLIFFPNFQTLAGLETQKNKNLITESLRTAWCPLLSIHYNEMDGRGQGTLTSREMKGRPRKVLAVSAFPLRMDGTGPLVA